MRFNHSLRLEIVVEYWSYWIHGDGLNFWLFFLEEFARAGHGSSGPNSSHQKIYASLSLLPDFGSGGLVMSLRILQVLVLPHKVGVGGLGMDSLGHLIVAFRRIRRNIRGSNRHLCAERSEKVYLFPTHLIRYGEDGSIAPNRRKYSYGHASVTRGGLYDRSSRSELAVLLGILQHVERHPVFHTSPGVQELQFC